jgi:DNA segregation ATPase FtsK/SpoIIIE-like protein
MVRAARGLARGSRRGVAVRDRTRAAGRDRAFHALEAISDGNPAYCAHATAHAGFARRSMAASRAPRAPAACAGQVPSRHLSWKRIPTRSRTGTVALEDRPGAARRKREDPHIVDHRDDRKKRNPEQEAFLFSEHTPQGPYQHPDIAIFQRPPDVGRSYDRDSLIMNSRILEKKLADFGVLGRVVTVHPGPVITMFEFEPGSGVKVNRITNLADDLALALRALSVRIIAPLPGKSVVGIEIPNPERDVVYLRDLLESENFRKSKSKLTLALGKDIFGNPV